MWILLHSVVQFDEQHLLKMLFFPVCISVFFIKNQVSIGVWIYVWVFDSIPLINMSIFVPIPCCFYYDISVVSLEIRNGDANLDLLFFMIVLVILYFLCFHMKLKIVPSN